MTRLRRPGALGVAYSSARARVPAGAASHADWSVEAHLPACAQCCRAALAVEVDAGQAGAESLSTAHQAGAVASRRTGDAYDRTPADRACRTARGPVRRSPACMAAAVGDAITAAVLACRCWSLVLGNGDRRPRDLSLSTPKQLGAASTAPSAGLLALPPPGSAAAAGGSGGCLPCPGWTPQPIWPPPRRCRGSGCAACGRWR